MQSTNCSFTVSLTVDGSQQSNTVVRSDQINCSGVLSGQANLVLGVGQVVRLIKSSGFLNLDGSPAIGASISFIKVN